MEEALNYCFKFVRSTAKTWVRLKKANYARTMQFQKQIFPEKVTFDGKKFGTNKLSLFYKMNKESGIDKSQLVSLLVIEPKVFIMG